jgi:hypothetical protein
MKPWRHSRPWDPMLWPNRQECQLQLCVLPTLYPQAPLLHLKLGFSMRNHPLRLAPAPPESHHKTNSPIQSSQSVSQRDTHTWQGHKMTRGAKKCNTFPSDEILQQQIPTDKWLYLHSYTHCRHKWKLDWMLAIL